MLNVSNIFIGGKIFCVPKFSKSSDLPYLFNAVALGKRLSGKLKEEEDFDEIVGNFIVAFTDYYLPTFEKYSNPKNVLELWDSLPTMLSKADNFPSADNYSKIIILSKMSKDENYQKRIDQTRYFFKSEIDKGEDWVQNKLDVFEKVIKYLEKNEV